MDQNVIYLSIFHYLEEKKNIEFHNLMNRTHTAQHLEANEIQYNMSGFQFKDMWHSVYSFCVNIPHISKTKMKRANLR